MNIKKYIVELLGTFALAVLVVFSVSSQLAPITPIIAALVVMLFVYTVGPISGAHINPAITLGLLSVKKISLKEAGMYIVAQALAAVLVLGVTVKFLGAPVEFDFKANLNQHVFWAEFFGTFLFAFGIASVVYHSVDKALSGVVIGGSLLLGIVTATLIGSYGLLNPAVALATQSVNALYILAPIAGAIVAMQLYAWLMKKEVTFVG